MPRHGGQIRAASLARALSLAGWQVETAGIYHASLFPAHESGAFDIIIDDAAIGQRATEDMLFADLHVARAAAANRVAVDQLRMLLRRLRPDVVQCEHPWAWPILQAALTSVPRPKLVYSSHNLEWSVRLKLLDLALGLNRAGSDRLIAATRQLETMAAREADLVLSISDTEALSIAHDVGRDVVYLPPVSDLADSREPAHAAFGHAARDRRCRYAALIGSFYWPNVEGFFSIFPHGLGFLMQDEQIWVAGNLGGALQADPRYGDFRSVNDVRLRALGWVDDADKPAFFAAASCIIVPVQVGGGAKQKTADALATNCPIITTSHAIDGYAPLVRDMLGRGVYVADTPQDFRTLMRRALRDGLAACPPEILDRVSTRSMTCRLAPLFARLIQT